MFCWNHYVEAVIDCPFLDSFYEEIGGNTETTYYCEAPVQPAKHCPPEQKEYPRGIPDGVPRGSDFPSDCPLHKITVMVSMTKEG